MFYYTYKIEFEDGHYYFGSRKSKVHPDQDTEYVGSPITNKNYWVNPFKKTILNLFDCGKSMLLAESELIGDNHKKDSLCLNRHNTKTFSVVGLV